MAQQNRLSRTLYGLICLVCLLLPLVGNLHAANLTEELRVSRQLEGAEPDGKAIWLEADSGKFLALSSSASGVEQVGGVILMHDTGAHADWHAVIGPLRDFLSRSGWDVLSLQMPVLTDENLPIPEAFWRETNSHIQAAVNHLSGLGNNNLVLIGQGLGAQAALDYLAGQASPLVRAIVAIGLSTGMTPEDRFIKSIEETNRPMLDIYGSRDRPEVTESVEFRLSAGKKNRQGAYRQDRILGADHYFRGLEPSLQRRIDAWMKRVIQDVRR